MTAIDDRCFKPRVGLLPEKISFLFSGLSLLSVILIFVGIQFLLNKMIPSALIVTGGMIVMTCLFLQQKQVLKISSVYLPSHRPLFRDKSFTHSIQNYDPSLAADLTGLNDEIC